MMCARRILASVLVLAALTALPGSVRAQGAGARGDTASRAAMLAERQRVRADLERADADVDALKHANRSLRDDYRLRARLADAEALARQLSALDARLGIRTRSAAPRPAASFEPNVSASDGPAEIDAKADILVDEARRLSARADALLGRAGDLRARQTLRRRVGQMERDPFSPLEGSKRRAVAAGVTSSLAGAPSSKSQAPPVTAPTSPVSGSGTGQSAPGDTTVGVATPAVGSAAIRPGTEVASTPAPSSPGLALTTPKAAPTPAGTAGSSEAVSLSTQLRDLLDPTTLAEIQRLEAAGGATSGLDALERAAAVLKARAARLDHEAAALRAAERAPPRGR